MEQFEQTSVNTGEVAETQTETVQSENTSEVAEPKAVQDAETNAHFAEQRRKQELEQYRSQAETYQQQLDRAARLAGYSSHDELISALDELEQQQQRQRYEEAGINPEVFNQFLEQHPDIQFARELKAKQETEKRFQEEANELFQEFPDLKPDQIPNEVFQVKEQRGLSLLDAYLRVNHKNLSQQKEQEVIKKLQQNQITSPGALGQEGSEHKSSYSQLSASEKAKLRERVLRGEATSIF